MQKVEQAAAKLSHKADQIDALQAHLASLDLWTRPEPGARRPRFTRDEIARAAVHIADTEGFEALSMRRLAQALDAGTMTLYHYVRTKEELLALVNDTVMGEVLVPDGELAARWRPAITAIAHRSRASIARHPWVLDARYEGMPGPNAVRHFDQSLRAVAAFGSTVDERLELVSVVDAYVFGFCLSERTNPADENQRAFTPYINGLLDGGGYPALAELRNTLGLPGTWKLIDRVFNDPERFDRGLDRLLDGYETQKNPRSQL